MDRHASVDLRHHVDRAVGPGYDRVFLRLDLLMTSREGRCGCAGCASYVAEQRALLVSSLPPL
ncbi:hypothetical protein [Actinomycetospora cinnamomea]|uniref:Uncharacterized protein n=1 Tax=Actinomycetospora cinnamomea TaxID=663609 RepID=A0A2U1FBT7_9PSEU|nr:hypothetical protein [Actinomycetospora cinnamomea]PVZ09626.1 hypothetical protein C8D89_106290 [Actinomycetospora cinnamomea]